MSDCSNRCRTRTNHAQARHDRIGGHEHRVVRLLPLWHRCRDCVPQTVLFAGHAAAGGAARIVQHLRRRLPRATDRRHRVWPFRRSGRSQIGAGDGAAGDGRCDHANRFSTDIRDDRSGRAIVSHPTPVRTGACYRRTVGAARCCWSPRTPRPTRGASMARLRRPVRQWE